MSTETMIEQDFGIDRRPKDVRPSAIEGIGGAIEQDLGYDVRPWDKRPTA